MAKPLITYYVYVRHNEPEGEEPYLSVNYTKRKERAEAKDVLHYYEVTVYRQMVRLKNYLTAHMYCIHAILDTYPKMDKKLYSAFMKAIYD